MDFSDTVVRLLILQGFLQIDHCVVDPVLTEGCKWKLVSVEVSELLKERCLLAAALLLLELLQAVPKCAGLVDDKCLGDLVVEEYWEVLQKRTELACWISTYFGCKLIANIDSIEDFDNSELTSLSTVFLVVGLVQLRARALDLKFLFVTFDFVEMVVSEKGWLLICNFDDFALSASPHWTEELFVRIEIT